MILCAWLAADFISGLVHWWEDRALVGSSGIEFINGVREDNERHHKTPSHFLRLTYWQNINTTAPFAFSFALALFFTLGPGFIFFTVLFLGFGNLIHRWAHEPQNRCPKIVRMVQRTGLFISFQQHSEHHFDKLTGKLLMRERSCRRFCVMTSWLNPLLDRIGFFTFLTYIIK